MHLAMSTDSNLITTFSDSECKTTIPQCRLFTVEALPQGQDMLEGLVRLEPVHEQNAVRFCSHRVSLVTEWITN